MRTLVIGGALVALVVALAACGGSSSSSASEEALQRESDLYAISQIEKTFHEAISKKDIDHDDEPVRPERDRHVRPRETVSGKDADPGRLAEARLHSSPRRTGCPTIPRTSSRSPSTETAARSTSNATSSTCSTRKGRSGHGWQPRRREDRRPLADHELRRKHGRAEESEHVSRARVPQQRSAAGAPRRRLLSPADNPLVRAVGRVPAGVHAKLLVAFVGTALLVVVLGVLGLRLLGQSNERVETLGTLQERAFAYGKLRSDALHVRLLLAAEHRRGLLQGLPGRERERSSLQPVRPSTAAIASAVAQIPASTSPTISASGLRPRTRRFLRRIRATGERARERDARDHRDRRQRACTRARPFASGPSCSRSISTSRPPSSRMRRRARTDALIAQNASAYTSSRNLFIGVAAGAIVLALLLGFVLSLVADRADPADRLPAGRDCLRGLLGSRGRHQPRRAGCAGGQREPDERRAPAPLPGARDRQQAQVGVPGQHVARAADAAERDHRLLAGAPRGDRPARSTRSRRSTSTTSSPRATTCWRSSTTSSTCPRSRPGQVRAAGRAVLAPGRARARRLDGARTGDEGRRSGDAPRQRRPRRRHRRRAADQAGHLQPALERREVHAAGRAGRRHRDAGPTARCRVSVADTRPGHRRRGSRPDLRGVPADGGRCQAPRRNRVSALRFRSGSSRCTAAGSGATARSAREARSCSRSRRGRSSR